MAEDDDTSGLNVEDAINANSPLTAMGAIKEGSGSSPLSSRLLSRAEELAPDKADIDTRRANLMAAYKNLIEAQRYRGSAVKDPGAVAFAANSLQDAWNPSVGAFGRGLAAEAGVNQGLLDKKQAAEENQAKTGAEAANANLGFLNSDLGSEEKMYEIGSSIDYKNALMQLRGMGKESIVRDRNGNPIGRINSLTGKVEPLSGSGTPGSIQIGNQKTPGGAPLAPIPGIQPGSPAHQGISQILAENDVDPNSLSTRTKADDSQAIKDAAGARSTVDGAVKAARIAKQAQSALESGYQGGALGGVESFGSAMLPESMQPEWIKNRDLIDKYNKDISSALATQMKGSRIGIGMERFLAGSTFNTSISKDANLQIMHNLQNLPLIAQRNMDIENATNSLPQSAKNTVYSEFLNDNPPYIETPDPKNPDDPKKSKFDLNPAYNDPQMVRKWFAARAQGSNRAAPSAAVQQGAEKIPSSFTADEWNMLTPEEKKTLKK